jgi:hypothetical protein
MAWVWLFHEYFWVSRNNLINVATYLTVAYLVGIIVLNSSLKRKYLGEYIVYPPFLQ